MSADPILVTPPPAASIIIPNLNGESLIAACLTSLRRAQASEAEVLFVDNGSTDRSLEIAQRTLPSIRVIANNRNAGFARACNQGAHAARGEYLLFLNSDVVLSPSCLSGLVEWARHDPEGAAWQPKLLRKDEKTWDSVGSYFTRTGFLWHAHFLEEDSPLLASAMDVFALKGACLLVRRDIFIAIGGFDEDFFTYFEDSDFCWRLHLTGWKVRFVPINRAIHAVGATTTQYFSSDDIDFLSFRNRVVSILKNAELRTLIRVLPVHVSLSLGVAGLFLVRGRWRNARAIGAAMVWPVRNARKVRKKRQETQILRVRSDDSFLPELTARMTLLRGYRLVSTYLPRW